MSASNVSLAPSAELQGRFLALVPKIETHARIFFRQIKCNFKKADFIAETVALAWRWFVRRAQRGKDAAQFVSTLASLAARAVWNGRRLCGQEKSKDVMSPLAQRIHGFQVEALPAHTRTSPQKLCAMSGGQEMHDAMEERLFDNTVTPVPDQAAFRMDFPAWLATLTSRERRLIRAMLQNERTLDLSRRFDLSPGRISQLRREFQVGWERYCGDIAEDAQETDTQAA